MLTFSPKRLNFEKIFFKLLTNLFLDDILLSQLNKNNCPKTASGTFHKPKLVLAEEKNMRKVKPLVLHSGIGGFVLLLTQNLLKGENREC